VNTPNNRFGFGVCLPTHGKTSSSHKPPFVDPEDHQLRSESLVVVVCLCITQYRPRVTRTASLAVVFRGVPSCGERKTSLFFRIAWQGRVEPDACLRTPITLSGCAIRSIDFATSMIYDRSLWVVIAAEQDLLGEWGYAVRNRDKGSEQSIIVY